MNTTPAYLIMYSILQTILYCVIIKVIYRIVSQHNCITITEPHVVNPIIYCAIENNDHITDSHLHIIEEEESNYDDYININATWSTNTQVSVYDTRYNRRFDQ